MESNETVMKVGAAIAMLECLDEGMYTKRGKTRKWIKRREEKDYFNNIIKELRSEGHCFTQGNVANGSCFFLVYFDKY